LVEVTRIGHSSFLLDLKDRDRIWIDKKTEGTGYWTAC